MGLIDKEDFSKRFWKLDIPFRPSQIQAVFECIGNCELVNAAIVVCCKDCRYSVDYYKDGDCYCEHDDGLQYVGKNWNHYCGWAVRKEE